MKSFFLIVTALLSTSVIAQSGGGSVLPQCAQQCALQAIKASGCGSIDPTCVCKNPSFATDFVKCANSNCSPEEAANAIKTGLQICSAAGISIPTPGAPSASAGGASTPSGSASSPIVPPPVIPTTPMTAGSSYVPPIIPVPPTPVPAPPVSSTPVPAPPAPTTPVPPVPTAGAGITNTFNAVLASIGLAWVSLMFLFLM
ncbi:hypothetical protein FHETE_9356 [Fusarium heterosporum]|uniref:CFEM domain-containing protein n=1 Tax=Fusarium heterosporum TaxID=42747 RepID=A0A8H5SZE0_FUSHE|nr:hypothetical protein FHETE_9356 [Fusarium heterosporum]